jgi:Pyridine nucleotide-disulphide oxidoreductase
MSYGSAPSEAAGHRDQDVVLVGGANSAGQAALLLAAYARSVTMIVGADSLQAGMSRYLVDRIIPHPNITVLTRNRVISADGQGRLETVTVADREGHSRELRADAMYMLIGGQPLTAGVEGRLRRDESGYLITGADLHADTRVKWWSLARDPLPLESSQPGVFVAGDTTPRTLATLERSRPSISISLSRERCPRTIVTADVGTRSRLASNRRSDSLARPSIAARSPVRSARLLEIRRARCGGQTPARQTRPSRLARSASSRHLGGRSISRCTPRCGAP